MSSELRIVICNCSPDESEELAEALVDESLAACVNILPPITSVYEWEGEAKSESEHTLIIKTMRTHWPYLRDRIAELHSYDCPEIIALDADNVWDAYEEWVSEEVGPDHTPGSTIDD